MLWNPPAVFFFFFFQTNEWSKNDERLLSAVEHGETEKVTSLLAKKGASATKLDGEGKSAWVQREAQASLIDVNFNYIPNWYFCPDIVSKSKISVY